MDQKWEGERERGGVVGRRIRVWRIEVDPQNAGVWKDDDGGLETGMGEPRERKTVDSSVDASVDSSV